MAFSTPTSSPVRQEPHNPHPYAIKTTQTGLLTRSNSSKAHGSWSRHHYTPVPPSPSAFVFDPPELSPSPTRHDTKRPPEAQSVRASPSHRSYKHESSQRSERGDSMSLPASKTWLGRDSEGEEIKLPRHPYLWTPAQLTTYLASELCNSDGEPLDSDTVKDILDFIQQRKIGGRVFLGFDQEDFQEMEGVDFVWGNALWDASCTLRQDTAPYRPSRVSSAAYKRGRVRGMVGVFERSASESSDAGEDDPRNQSPGKLTPARRQPTAAHLHHTPSQDWNNPESDDNCGESAPRIHSQENSVASAGRPLEERISSFNADPPTMPNAGYNMGLQPPSSAQDASIWNASIPLPSDDHGIMQGSPLTAVLPPRSSTPVHLVLGPEVSQHRQSIPDSDVQDETPNPTRDVEIVSIPRPEDSEPTMAELYQQTYGVFPPSPHGEQPVPLTSDDLSDYEDPPGETVKISAATSFPPERPPTALRPVARRKVSTPPPSLTHLFVPSPMIESARGVEPQNVYMLPPINSNDNEGALRTLDALKERLEIVERRLEEMEKKDVAASKVLHPMMPLHPKADEHTFVSIEEALGDFGLEVHSSHRHENVNLEVQRSWQSAYILLAGATTGVSVVLIPLLLRHLWTR